MGTRGCAHDARARRLRRGGVARRAARRRRAPWRAGVSLVGSQQAQRGARPSPGERACGRPPTDRAGGRRGGELPTGDRDAASARVRRLRRSAPWPRLRVDHRFRVPRALREREGLRRRGHGQDGRHGTRDRLGAPAGSCVSGRPVRELQRRARGTARHPGRALRPRAHRTRTARRGRTRARARRARSMGVVPPRALQQVPAGLHAGAAVLGARRADAGFRVSTARVSRARRPLAPVLPELTAPLP